jgi:hypothetical protein
MNIIRPILINDAVLTDTDVIETDESEFLIGTTYAIDARVMVTTDTVHSIFVSLQNGNTGNQPEDEADPTTPVFWARESATNRWAMFSDQINDQTEKANSIEVELTPADLVNAISLFNLSAASVQVVMVDPVEGTVYDTTVNMVEASGVNDWYSWYFEPLQLQDTLALLDLPPFIDATITVTITRTGTDAKCGLVSIGSQKNLGETVHGTRVGIEDFSTKERDTFGNPIIIERNFIKRSDYAVVVDTAFVGAVESFLASLRTTPLTWIGDVSRPSTIVYGFYIDFNITLTDFITSNLNIEVEGLT